MTDQDDELWTPAQAAAYLNAGGVDLGFRARQIATMIDRHQLAGVRPHAGGWRKASAAAVRALRTTLLAELGRRDPGEATRPSGEDMGSEQG